VSRIESRILAERVRGRRTLSGGRLAVSPRGRLHDTNIYVRELVRHAGVKRWLKVLGKEKEHFEVIDFPFSSGVALVRVLSEGAWEPLNWYSQRSPSCCC